MGAGSSNLALTPFSKIATGKDLLAQTKDVREMSEALFKFMYSRWDQKEMWDIAKNPGDYVAALTEMIDNQFKILGYTTKDGRPGEIYFQRYAALNPPGEKDYTAIDNDTALTQVERDQLKALKKKGIDKHRENVTIIAFYFVRLFQIMGALLLVVKDISFPVIDPETKQIRDAGQSMPAFRRAYTDKFRARGGALSHVSRGLALGPFEFLRFYLRTIDSETIARYGTTYKVTLLPNWYKINDVLFLDYVAPSPLPETISSANKGKAKVILVVNKGYNKAELLTLEIQIIQLSPDNMPGYKAPSEFPPNEQLDRYPNLVSFKINVGSGAGQSSKQTKGIQLKRSTITVREDTYENGVQYEFESGTAAMAVVQSTTAIEKFTETMANAVLLEYSANPLVPKGYTLFKTKVEEKAISAASIGKLPPNMSSKTIDEMYQVLRNKNKTEVDQSKIDYDKVSQPHCISRALQLLDGTSIEAYMPTKATTKICKFSVGDSLSNTGLDKYVPIKSVAQLYGKVDPADFDASLKVLSAFVGKYTSTVLDDPTKEPLSVAELAEIDSKYKSQRYKPQEALDLEKALKRLQIAFNGMQDSSGSVTALKDITAKKSEKCGSKADVIEVTEPVALELQGYARQLMSYHVKKTIAIAKFLETIFDIRHESTGPVVNGPRLGFLTAGYDQLNIITDQARELLVDYYEGCETLYQKGVKAWEREQGDSVATGAPAAPTPPAAPPAAPPTPPAAPAVPPTPPAAPPANPAAQGPVAGRVAGVFAAREAQLLKEIQKEYDLEKGASSGNEAAVHAALKLAAQKKLDELRAKKGGSKLKNSTRRRS